MLKRQMNKQALVLAPIALSPAVVWATCSSGGITEIVCNVNQSLTSLASLISQVAFVAGLCFAAAAVMKFKQHKDNPTQVPVGTPISMVVMGAALMFLGNFIQPLGESIFGSAAGNSAGQNAAGITSGLSSSSSSGGSGSSSGSPF